MASKEDVLKSKENKNDEKIFDYQLNSNNSLENNKRTFFTGLP